MDKLETQTFPALFFTRDAAQTCRLEFSVIFFSILFFPYLLLFAALGVTNATKASRNGKNKRAVKDRGGRMARGSRRDVSRARYVSFLFFLLTFLTTFYLQTATTSILKHNHENFRARDASRVVSILVLLLY
jgi:hypothetical protein